MQLFNDVCDVFVGVDPTDTSSTTKSTALEVTLIETEYLVEGTTANARVADLFVNNILAVDT